MISQLLIGLCGVASIFLSQDERANVRRYACLSGLAAQPFWLYSTWHAGQYGIFALCFLYAGSWARGFWTHWVRRNA